MGKVKVSVNGNGKNKRIIMLAIICLTIIELTALALGFNGQILRWTTILISGLAGLILPTPNILRR